MIKPDGSGFSYNDFTATYEVVSNFIVSNGIFYFDRVAIISDHDLAHALLILPVMENAVAVPIDYDGSEKIFIEKLKLLKVAYLITDNINTLACKMAVSLGIGIIKFTFSGSMGNIKCHLSLVHNKKMPAIETQFRNESLALIRTTSGTTSTPKVVPRTYDNQFKVILQNLKYYHYDKNMFHLVTMKMSIGISIFNLLVTLYAEGKLMLGADSTYNELARVLNNEKISAFTANPAYLLSLADHMEDADIQIFNTDLKFIRSSGAPLSEQLQIRLERIFKAPVILSYGATETGIIATDYLAPNGRKKGSVGVPLDLKIKIEEDEIFVKGDTVFGGYETNSGYDRTSFKDGWFRTGDLGYIDEDGYLFITGRNKEMINRGGEKVSPYEVEDFIIKHPDVIDVAVFPWPDDNGIEEVAAVLVVKSNRTLNLQELRKHLLGAISHYKMPTLLFTAERIPTSKSGKVQRKELYKLFNHEHACEALTVNNLVGEKALSQTTIKQDTIHRLEILWQQILGRINRINSTDSFFLIGGDSLAAIALLAAIESEFGIQLPVNDIYKNSSLEKLAALIESHEASEETYHFAAPLVLGGIKQPLFCIHPASGEIVNYRFLADFINCRSVWGLKFEIDGAEWDKPLTFNKIASKYIEEVINICPDGPYYLYGHCLGGRIAAEMALQLKARGKIIALLAFFDPIIPLEDETAMDRIRNKISIKTKTTIKNIFQQPFGNPFNYYRNKLKGMLKIAKLGKDIARLDQQGGIANPSTQKEAILRVASQNSSSRPYDGKAYYFQPLEISINSKRSIIMWHKLVKDLEIIHVPFKHSLAMSPKSMQFIGEALSNKIDRFKV